jgi:threonyl-tRNA synthetase
LRYGRSRPRAALGTRRPADPRAAGARLDTGGSLAARVRRSRRRRDALIAVIGPTETAGGTVQITDPASRSNHRLARSDLITAVRRAHASRAPQASWPTPD